MVSQYGPVLIGLVVFLVALNVLSSIAPKRPRRSSMWRPPRQRYERPAAFAKLDPEFAAVLSDRPSEPPQPDRSAQLREVECAQFTARKLLNVGETRVFAALEAACAAEQLDWRVMAQVSLGEILASPSKFAYHAINAKRVDLLLVARDGSPIAAVEYQGSGHHLGPAATRDAIKKEALRKAGIGYLEVFGDDTPEDVHAIVRKLAGRRRGTQPPLPQASPANDTAPSGPASSPSAGGTISASSAVRVSDGR